MTNRLLFVLLLFFAPIKFDLSLARRLGQKKFLQTEISISNEKQKIRLKKQKKNYRNNKYNPRQKVLKKHFKYTSSRPRDKRFSNQKLIRRMFRNC
ncbi:hypothetical protein [Bacteriovorax sp. Seq25_V]|uniref:hypothetical protein n=1 Tax=Bacteriovorax sp. Seq25_V TaxID=1201288 RepID=UPI000389FA40|nr:hypothetical protein [Bacteriovorax sp. Seq25_V]EQC43754.1 hypothetical protein M900_1529 [Bacteriovorax sp. Seq25_V]